MRDCENLISHYKELLIKQSIWKVLFEVYDEKEELIKVMNFQRTTQCRLCLFS